MGITLPKNASKQVPEWRLMITSGRKPDEDRLPTRPFWRHWQRSLDDEIRRWDRAEKKWEAANPRDGAW